MPKILYLLILSECLERISSNGVTVNTLQNQFTWTYDSDGYSSPPCALPTNSHGVAVPDNGFGL